MGDYGESDFYPSDMLAEYKSISVLTDDSVVQVGINKYRCSIYGGGTKDAESIKDGFIAASGGSILKEAGGAQAYVDVFTGKASPNMIAKVVGLVNEYRHAFIKQNANASGPRGDCVEIFQDYSFSPKTMLQQFCDRFLGLDCNGFVGNWVKRVQHGWMGPQTSPKIFYQSGKYRDSSDDIDAWDLIIWDNFTHIAVVDDWYEDGTFDICQSTGGGPQNTNHELIRTGTGLFKLSPASKVGGNVHVVTLGL